MKNNEFWFITGGQHLYGTEAFAEMNSHGETIASSLDKKVSGKLIYKGLVTTTDEIKDIMTAANTDPKCVGVICWMHVFSPAKMWIAGLKNLKKPMLHLHTQFNREIPWDTIDMDYMNLNQSAHGDREFGFIGTRLGIERKVVVGFWDDKDVADEIDIWMRAAAAWNFSQNLKVCRFGDNMRYVAVTEGDKVEAEIKLGWAVNGYGVGDLVKEINKVTDAEIDAKIAEYKERYEFNTGDMESVRIQASYEIAMKRFLDAKGCKAFTNTFEDLNGMRQLPGLASQRLLEDGYGYGAEGDWKTSALTAVMKYMAKGLDGGTAFMEDYTYNFAPSGASILGAHMLEVCPTIAANKPKIEVHPLGIGGKEPPARLVFDGQTGDAVAVSIIDLGTRFRMIVAKVKLIEIEKKMPRLPVARVMWVPYPDLKTGAAAWIYAGGAHHTCLSNCLTVEHMRDFASMAGIECVVIDENTDINRFKAELKYASAIY